MHSEIVRRQGRLWTPFLTVSAFVLAVQSHAADEVQRPVNERFAAADTQEIPSFQRHVVNLFGRLGCNGRSCHGSFQGRGGFQLSLFGYDFKADHAALLAKDSPRIDVAHPEQSLILVKPTQPDGDGFSPDDVAATFYHSLGIDHTKEYQDQHRTADYHRPRRSDHPRTVLLTLAHVPPVNTDGRRLFSHAGIREQGRPRDAIVTPVLWSYTHEERRTYPVDPGPGGRHRFAAVGG